MQTYIDSSPSETQITFCPECGSLYEKTGNQSDETDSVLCFMCYRQQRPKY